MTLSTSISHLVCEPLPSERRLPLTDVSLSDGDFAFVRELVRETAGTVLQPYKQSLVIQRLAPLAARCGWGSLAKLIAVLRARRNVLDAELRHAVVASLLNRETAFFRDLCCFDTLRASVLPRILERRAAEKTLDVWCAGASTGQEAYSTAMLLAEFPKLAGWNVRIVGCDFSRELVQHARAGIYSEPELASLPEAMIARHFDRLPRGGWRVSTDLRRRVEFNAHNLIGEWPALPRFDVVLFRYVMPSWDLETKRQVLARIRHQLRPDGVLVLGACESPYFIDDRFDRINALTCCSFRLRSAASIWA